MAAIQRTAMQNTEILKTLKLHIGMGLERPAGEDRSLDIQVRIAEINAEFKRMLEAVSADVTGASSNEEAMTELMLEKRGLENELEQYAAARQKRDATESRINEIYTILDAMSNHPMQFDNQLIRQLLECVVVESKEQIKVVFVGGLELIQPLNA